MRAALVAAAVLAASAHAQRQHTTQDELTISRTVYTYPGAAGADEELTTVPTGRHTTTLWDFNGDPVVTTWTGTRIPTLSTPAEEEAPTTTSTKEAVDDAGAGAGGAQGGNKGIQGPPTTTYPPMTATTYGYKNQAGDWVTTEWTQSWTAPAEATAEVSQGTIQGMQEYKDAQKSFTDKAVQPGSAKQGSSSGAERVAPGAAALLAAVAFYAF
ncbi:hypothetical protein A1Q1_00300 [Trichosporon asahii var. asahii CBS 2479]|uniref:Uncharacterized protein n=1 Tax=Trichosporon asahii var. asahii (strain ATCC 90039 / CBS 2479 / JCM 2466 / KCTC 7840 / NBRC 103889/ NCYC 2677 / UAMH 7654) TaxID=1186058 RepID=J8TIB9_TRIAS|nr:hypothetical protein A1Q1_00300 [Trichosporon asahii var. asahii CBS 2479]EJT52986.1 hypothetical protein A1Q1_00300 [Trichosporon asahii var. asahii CBS 2479]